MKDKRIDLMKGQGEIVAIILVLMIVVSLVALAYIWFTGVFGILTRTAGTGVEQTTTAMSTSFLIETATYENDVVKIYIKNVGIEDIDLTKISLYFDNLAGVYLMSDTEATIRDCLPAACTNNILTTGKRVPLEYDLSGAGGLSCTVKNVVRVTTATGLMQVKAIKCL